MQAVILAGGVGSRLETLTDGKPKCLAEIGGRPLILHQLEALSDHGIGPVLMVVGYNHEAIRAVVGQRVEYVVNERFRDTNSLYSLWLAREWIKGPFLLLNADLFFDPEILARLLEDPGNVLAYDSTSSRGREQTKVAIRGRKVIDLGKDLPPASARGESLGLLKFEPDGATAMLDTAKQLVEQGQEQAWVIEATRAVCKMVPLYGVNVAGLPWTEVDFPHDLEEARSEVWPAIWKGRWRRAVYWKRTRWAVAGLVALVLAVAGWLASTRVGPASVDWENVPPLGAAAVRLTVPTGRQKWWLLRRGDSVSAQVDGGAPLRIEFRLIMAPQRTDSGRYVVAVSVDGTPHDWDAFTASRDSAATFQGRAVGDRDRLQFELPPGRHIVQFTLVAGHGDALLVRIRRPE
ncbi:MAG TPA: phosphocholine cytidylyltransferase family protein [Gemmatimonadales bacterium]|nr:phosphocholine cytidylyltransferase family protein [Gemmatimonadales bacterium]